jgi:hypothetical protein
MPGDTLPVQSDGKSALERAKEVYTSVMATLAVGSIADATYRSLPGKGFMEGFVRSVLGIVLVSVVVRFFLGNARMAEFANAQPRSFMQWLWRVMDLSIEGIVYATIASAGIYLQDYKDGESRYWAFSLLATAAIDTGWMLTAFWRKRKWEEPEAAWFLIDLIVGLLFGAVLFLLSWRGPLLMVAASVISVAATVGDLFFNKKFWLGGITADRDEVNLIRNTISPLHVPQRSGVEADDALTTAPPLAEASAPPSVRPPADQKR